MIKALFLISKPGVAWDRVVQSGRSLVWVLFFYLLPMMLVVAAAEGLGLMEWGKRQAAIGLHPGNSARAKRWFMS